MNNKILITSLVFCSSLTANEEINLFSPTQKSIIETKEKIINEDKKLNQKSWLSDINISSNISEDNNGNTSKSMSLSYEQDIFKFGGIFETIDLAKIQEQYDLLDLKITFSEYLNNIYSNTLNAKITDLSIEKQKLTILNKEIDLAILKSEYSAGEVGISDLNDTIMEKNTLEEELINLFKSKKQYLLSLKQYTNKDYQNIDIPNLKIKKLDDFIKNSKDVNLSVYSEEIAKSTYKIKKTDYMPTISFSSSYNKNYENTEDETYNYGVNLTIPISFSTLNDIEKSKLEYLLSKNEKEQKIIDESMEYEKLIQNIETYENLKNIANKDIILYEELLQTVKDEYNAGYKAIEDVEVLSNTKKMRELDLKINDLNIQLELITMYY
ncbi:TolC family protein [Arcobacter arenosus]|uniref:TolC family protein n=1 Tax=Arcobacter arenosus TaxID=2576037 RepID=A0A5R8XYC5_9BACT|nr:TolC family protein [Arcobacter arenosus]TLP35863.1 TolC family protein [Arcobacter arenosus]